MTPVFLIPNDKLRHVRHVINKANLDLGRSGISGGFIQEKNSFVFNVNVLLPKKLDPKFVHSLIWTAIADCDSIYKDYAPRILKATIY